MPDKPVPYDHDHENEVTLFAKTNFRNQERVFGIKTDDRRRHMYFIGKTGMGKTTGMENIVVSDINAGHGLCFIDPHGDSADKLLDFIPTSRINDVVYFNPGDLSNPVGFNIFESANENQKHLIASGLMGVFKKIWPDVWSPRMEYILLNTVLALLDVPGATLLGISRILADDEYRKRVISLIQDPVVKTFWVKEFNSWQDKYRTEAIAPVQNKVGQFLSASIIRNIVAQVKSTIDMREIMDSRKIFIVNLSKGLVGEENMRLLGGMIITKMQMAAMERVDMPEHDRQDFYMFVDEFQNFANESFASILSEARKYRLNLAVGHQYIEQMDEVTRSAVFGNVGTLCCYRVGAADAEFLAQEFAPVFTAEDLVNLRKYDVYMRLMIDGVASEPFSASMLPPISRNTGNREKAISLSREKYASQRPDVETKILRWSGLAEREGEEEDVVAQDIISAASELGLDEKGLEKLSGSSPKIKEVAQSGGGSKKKKEAKYEIPCSVCGDIQKLTFEPDWSRPWFCKEHMSMKDKVPAPGPVGPKPIIVKPAADSRKPEEKKMSESAESRPRVDRSEKPRPLKKVVKPVSKPSAPVLVGDPETEGISLSALTARDEKKEVKKDPPSPRLRGADRGAEGQKKVGKSVEKTEKDGNEKKEDEGDKNVGSNDGPKTISPGDTVKF